eukprot:6485263-Amphidinium_carterae.1
MRQSQERDDLRDRHDHCPTQGRQALRRDLLDYRWRFCMAAPYPQRAARQCQSARQGNRNQPHPFV